MPRKRSSDRNVPFASNPLLRVKLPAYRSQIMMLFVAIAFVALAARAVWLQVFSQDFLQKQGESRYARTIELPASRGKIFDRNGIVLASSLPARAVWAVPEQVEATIVEADAVVKGQTASSSYKPAVLDNGVRVMVPPHIESGTRIVVDVYERTYVGKAN